MVDRKKIRRLRYEANIKRVLATNGSNVPALNALSTWGGGPNSRANLIQVLATILHRARVFREKTRPEYSAEIRNRSNKKLTELVKNAAIILNPTNHNVPANKYKGFLQRYGKSLSHARKKTILTGAPYVQKPSENNLKRFPEKIERVASQKPHEILAQLFFPKGPRPIQYLGGGTDGKVYITNDGRLMKFVLGNAPHEYTALRNLRSTGLVPSFRNVNGKVFALSGNYQNVASKMFGGNTNPAMTAFLMGKVGGEKSMTLRKYIQTHPSVNKENIEQRLRSAINTLGLKGISHGDMHQDNIIVEVDSTGRIRRMWLIDFGRSSKFNVGQTARNMFAVTRALLVKRGQKPKLFPTAGLYGNKRNVPLHGTKQNSRIDPHMFMTLTGKEYTRANEAQIRNYRKLIAGMKNRPRVTSKPRARSATPARRPNSANRSTSNTPRGSPKSTRASPRRSPPRPRSAA
jgi:hypothetical protein